MLYIVVMCLCLSHCKEVKIGFIFMFFKQKGNSILQQPEVWEKFFADAKNRAVVAFVNYQGANLPKFVDAYFTKPKALIPNGVGYVQTFLKVSKYMIDEYEASGIVLLSGAAVPIRCFDNIYGRISPHLKKGSSIIPEYISTDPEHVKRYYQVNKPVVTIDAWGIHPSTGYCVASNLITLALNMWDKVAREMRGVERFDEHYLSYLIRSALNPDSGHSRSGLRIYQEMDKRSLLYIEWGKKNPDGSLPYVWTQKLGQEEVDVLRNNEYFFVRDISNTCKVDIENLLKCS